MRKARLGEQSIEREAERLRTLLNLGLHVETDDLGGVNFTTTTTGSWVDTGLSITITPNRDVRCVGLLRALTCHNVANASLYYCIYCAGLPESQILWSSLEDVGGRWVPFTLWRLWNLIAGTSYTFKIRVYVITPGTLTLYGDVGFTEFALILANKAILA